MILLIESTDERVMIFIGDEDRERVYRAKEENKPWVYLSNIIEGKSRLWALDMVYPGIFEGKKEYQRTDRTVYVLD
jgi:hypothetical protein